MSLMEWSDIYALGVPEMDTTHREFMDGVNAADSAADADFLPCFDALIAHTVAHFERERAWMERLGFARDHCHLGEHERVLTLLNAVRDKMAEDGDLALGRRVLSEMPPWFDQHASLMDAPLAHYLKEQAGKDSRPAVKSAVP
ncbi:MAG: cation-binding hemerythrin HHE [Rhodocyclaceae bacterium]|nr:cation-binding hemerythrin HHE [Rhodocyclaceae bacterium]